MNEVTTTQRVVSINPNDVFAQFGLSTPETTQEVSQRVGTIEVRRVATDAEYTEVEPISIAAPTDNTNNANNVNSTTNAANNTNTPNEEINTEVVLPSPEALEEAIQNFINENTQTQDAVEQSISDSKEANLKDLIDLLPTNPKSLEVEETTSRFSGAAWFNAVQDSTVILAGLGGIGGYTAFLLSRMKPKQIFLYDDDEVELGNLSGQLYSKTMVGKKKVNAMAELVKDFSDYNGIMACPQKFTNETPAGDIMICGFDNMEARNTFFTTWLKHTIKSPHPEKCLFIDGRF